MIDHCHDLKIPVWFLNCTVRNKTATIKKVRIKEIILCEYEEDGQFYTEYRALIECPYDVEDFQEYEYYYNLTHFYKTKREALLESTRLIDQEKTIVKEKIWSLKRYLQSIENWERLLLIDHAD